MPELDQSQSRLLGALTLAALKHLGESTLVVDEDNNLCPWQMARLGNVVLLEKPADSRSPRRIDCYRIAEHSASGESFKLDSARLLYSLQSKHNAHPPDFHLSVLQERPEQWVNIANLTLLGALRRRAPDAIDWSGMREVVPVLDAFEAALESRTARPH